jgi:hypothetical protein
MTTMFREGMRTFIPPPPSSPKAAEGPSSPVFRVRWRRLFSFMRSILSRASMVLDSPSQRKKQ